MIPFVRWARSCWICRHGHDWTDPMGTTLHCGGFAIHYVERICRRCHAVEDLTDRGWKFIRWQGVKP